MQRLSRSPHRVWVTMGMEPEWIDGSGCVKKWRQRTPAMAVGLTNRVWTLREVLMCRVPLWLQAPGD
jgi:hypothetical protein